MFNDTIYNAILLMDIMDRAEEFMKQNLLRGYIVRIYKNLGVRSLLEDALRVTVDSILLVKQTSIPALVKNSSIRSSYMHNNTISQVTYQLNRIEPQRSLERVW